MDNLLKSAARKHALANGIATAKWDDDAFAEYVAENNISRRDHQTRNMGTELTGGATTAEVVEKKVAAKATGSIDEAVQALIAATQTTADLDEARVVDLIKTHSNAPRLTSVEIRHTETETVIKRDHVHKDYPIVMAHIAAGVNTAIVGPAGSGKSTMFSQIAEDLGLDYYITGAVQQESKIMGYNDANGKYVRTPFRDAFEKGGLFVMEEFDGCAAKAALALNNAVANEESDFPDGMVKRHAKFICVMAGNTFGTGASRQYVGRTQLDAATLDRFCFLDIGYDEALEMYAAKLAFDDAATEGWVHTVQLFRKKVEQSGIRHVVSPRASIMGAKLLKQGLPLTVITKSALHKGLSKDQINQLVK